MPNTGKPSLACHECRRRRVKCDLGRPGCIRCAKYDLVCPGYRDETDLRFRHSNSNTIRLKVTSGHRRRTDDKSKKVPGKSKKGESRTPVRQQRARACAAYQSDSSDRSGSAGGSPEGSGSSESEGDDIARLAVKGTTALMMKGPGHDWRNHTHRIVIDCYPWISVLEPLMHGVSENTPLSLATAMLARGYLVNRHILPDNVAEDVKVRDMCLKAVRNALTRRETQVMDSTLMSVWLMGTYDVLQGTVQWPPPRGASWSIHHTGLIKLIDARGLDQFRTAQGRQLFWLCVETIQIHFNAMNQSCPEMLLQWLHIYSQWRTSPVEKISLASAFLAAKYSNIFPQMLHIITRDDPEFAAAVTLPLLAQMDDLEREYEVYLNMQVTNEDKARACRMYKLPVGRLKLHNLLFYILNLAVQGDPLPADLTLDFITARKNKTLMTIWGIAEDILSTAPPASVLRADSIPEGVAWSKNLGMMYPFAAICHMQTPRFEQRIRAREVLRFIGWVCGIRQALQPAMGSRVRGRAMKDCTEVIIVGPNGIMP